MPAPIRPSPIIPMRMRPPGRVRPGLPLRDKGSLSRMLERMVLRDADEAAEWAARIMAAALGDAVTARGRASLALSGGHSPWAMMGMLFARDLPWAAVDLLQVDERVAPDGDEQRNLTHIAKLRHGTPAERARMHAIPIAGGADAAARAYCETVRALGDPIDIVQLGLGDDGHTASLAPGDPVLAVRDAPVAATAGPFNGTRRVTLTYPALDAARLVVWLVIGASKREMANRLTAGDDGIPAGRVAAARQVLVLDAAAAG